jgi:hypothetical protein
MADGRERHRLRKEPGRTAGHSKLELYHTEERFTMAEPELTTNPPETPAPGGPARSKDEIALELTKFIASATGYGKPAQTGAGFSSKPASRTVEEHAEALLNLFARCRQAVNK